MANTLIPYEERSLSPEQVERVDRRRRRGQLFLVICFQCLIVCGFLSLWVGQDLTYSPGWARIIFYWNAIVGFLAVVFGLLGLGLRRGSTEFISY